MAGTSSVEQLTSQESLEQILARLTSVRRVPENNPFRILRINDDEVRQSAWVAGLVQADASHGRGPELLQRIVDAIGDPFDCGRDYTVRTEFSRFHSQVDIAIASPGPAGFLLFIENKIWSGFGKAQLERQQQDLLLTASQFGIPSRSCRLIVLQPEHAFSDLPASTAAITYRQLGAVVKHEVPLMSPEWRSWVEAWLRSLPTRTPPRERSSRTELSKHADRQIHELLQRVARRVAAELHDLPAEEMRLPGRGKAPSGQADLILRWRSEAMQDIQLGVEWLWPEYLVSDRLGEQPRFWVWHKSGRSAQLAIVAAALKRFDSYTPGEVSRDERRRRYLYQETLPTYIPGEHGFAARFEDRLVGLFTSWARLLDTIDQDLAALKHPLTDN